MASEWIGLVINGQYHHGDQSLVVREIGHILGEDSVSSKIVCTPMMAKTGEYYLFVRCKDFHNHAEDIGKSLAVLRGIPSLTSPYLFSDEEVRQFSGSVDCPDEKVKLEYGDMVLVKKGYLKGLYGIIIGELKNGKRVVAFSFYMRKFKENLNPTDLEFITKALKGRKPRPLQKRSCLVNNNQVRREGRRKYTRKKRTE